MRPYQTSFFQFIRNTFGFETVRLLKTWIAFRFKLTKSTLQTKFIKFCISHSLVPPHLKSVQNVKLEFFKNNLSTRLDQLKWGFVKNILKLELSDTYRKVDFFRTQLFRVAREISRQLPVRICENFFSRQDKSSYLFYLKEKNRIEAKCNWLLFRRDKKLEEDRNKSIAPIQYYQMSADSCEQGRGGDVSLSLYPDRTGSIGRTVNVVRIDHQSFVSQSPLPSFSTPRTGWFVNMSSVVIPPQIRNFLQLGENFALPATNKSKVAFEFIKCIESNNSKLPMSVQGSISNYSLPILNSLVSCPPPQNNMDVELLRLSRETRNFIRETGDSVIFTRADKGNVTVALDSDRYVSAVQDMLQDTNTYERLNKDPTKGVLTNLRSLLASWKNKGYINEAKYRMLMRGNGTLPRAYGLPKIHKENCPFRLIVSSLDTPLYQLALFLHNIIIKTIPKADSHIENSFQLVNKLKGTHLNDDYSLISLDVVSLFTNVPVDYALDCINDYWQFISTDCDLPKNEFIKAIQFILKSTFFTFNKIIYRQNYGTPMGSPLSPVVADLVMRGLEVRALASVEVPLTFYYRYVDDIIMAAPVESIDSILETFNSQHSRVQFTMEVGGNTLNFLDVTLINNEGVIEFNWYHKPTFSGRYLNFSSKHPMSQKRGTVSGLVDRAILLSHPKFQHDNLCLVIKILLDNDYPLKFIFDNINKRLKNIVFPKRGEGGNVDGGDLVRTLWFTIPYVPTISERFKRLNSESMKTTFYSINKLSEFIKVHKDPLPREMKSNVVYKINCKDCDASYVGQTRRQLKTRVAEHRNHIHWNTTTRSVITDHRLETDHEFDWENVSILDDEPHYKRRLISEMLHIKKQTHGLNLHTDMEGLPKVYFPIVERL